MFILQIKNLSKIQAKLNSYKKVLIEQYIPGREIQVAIMGDKKLGAIELRPKRKFYDYRATCILLLVYTARLKLFYNY